MGYGNSFILAKPMGNSGYPLAQINNRTSISNRTFKKHRFYTFQKGASAVMWKMSRTSLVLQERTRSRWS
ncbi:hypothetical protein Avbf_11101 [Armadillidium vulgare]|nr:hypothetical protein Avbf_11101 [Armadillidium vulgare]